MSKTTRDGKRKVDLDVGSWCIIYKRFDYSTPTIDGGYTSKKWAAQVADWMKEEGVEIFGVISVADLLRRLESK